MKPSTSICFYFEVHQPYRIRRFRVFDIGGGGSYFDDDSETNLNNVRILKKVAEKCYLPANRVLLELLERHPEFKISFSFSGVFLEQVEELSKEVLESFRALVRTGRVEILDETYHHSLSFLYSREEFIEQVRLHREAVRRLFGVIPTAFRNTELIYNNELAHVAESLGYSAILAEGADHILGWRSPNFVYRPRGAKTIALLLKNYRLSDDIAFRFSSRDWSEYPLRAERYGEWIGAAASSGAKTINLFMDYETFGEHQWADTGIFEFMRALPEVLRRNPRLSFATPTEVARTIQAEAELDVPQYISWADIERDLSAWRSNELQQDALKQVYELEAPIRASRDAGLLSDWRRLQTSDHFYYMCTKWWNDGDVHKYFNPYDSPYEAYIAYMNVLHDMRIRLGKYRDMSVPKSAPVVVY
ncbi:MAG: polysaccharide deacetylase family protein [Candidatus Vogelbacteria bacterium]|nr:polysaccharide deacetylase family protein [Candidatus Vogelbacteria bacterium]